MKNLFKYVHQGYDRATTIIENPESTIDNDEIYVHQGYDRATTIIENPESTIDNDEIKKYLDCRYILATKACWRIFQFDIHHRNQLLSSHLKI